MGKEPGDEAFLAILRRVLRARHAAAEARRRTEVLTAQTRLCVRSSLELLRRSRQELDED